jgi:predicted O-linked N-acetylglucosamine transferase (SPINDLY family)
MSLDRSAAEYRLGMTLEAQDRLQDALAAYDRAIALDPDNAGAWNNRGNILRRTGRLEDAVASLDRAVALAPRHAAPLTNRGNTLLTLNRHAEAAADFRRLLEMAPGDPNAPGGLLTAAQALCDWDMVDALLPRLGAAAAQGAAIVPPLTMLFSFDDPALLHDAAAHFLQTQVTAPPAPSLPLVRRDGKIRIAYLSSDFQTHATAWLMADLFERHDRGRFEVIGVSWGTDNGGPLRARLARGFDRFVDARHLSDAEIVAQLRQMPVDIAIDLKGHTQGARPGIFNRRAAPVQVNWLGFPGGMASPVHDYILADAVVLPHAQQPFYDERIVHLPDCYQPNDPSRPLAAATRAEAGLPPEALVFACFNHYRKITRSVFDCWMRLLVATPGSVLWLLQDAASETLRRRAAAGGVDPARLVFAPWTSLDANLARIACADIVLDTLPCGAHTTASDALWMGVPVVTRLGKSFAGRVAASLLTAIGAADLITGTMAEYEALALALARDPAALTALKQRLAANRHTAPLFDAPRFCRHLERAYEMMLDQATPQPFDVPVLERS